MSADAIAVLVGLVVAVLAVGVERALVWAAGAGRRDGDMIRKRLARRERGDTSADPL